MTVGAVQQILEAWAPREIAWERDNVGLQCGDPAEEVRAILVTLDVTDAVIDEAVQRGANLIISHHPLIFRPLTAISTATATGRALAMLLHHGIALIAAHTNMDFTRSGTSFALADRLALAQQEMLHTTYQVHKKVVTYVPAEHADAVAAAMSAAGAGVIGNYDQCSFRVEGTGTFRGGEGTRPAVGEPGKLERVPEIRLEMLVPQWRVDAAVRAMRSVHPYEEVAYDVIPTEAVSARYGMGVIGTLPAPETLGAFLSRVRTALGTGPLRYCGDPEARVQRIAVCGGSGGELLEAAIARQADVFVTADVKYHRFRDAEGVIALVDAGHFETEYPVVPAIVGRLRSELGSAGDGIPVKTAHGSTNPVRFM